MTRIVFELDETEKDQFVAIADQVETLRLSEVKEVTLSVDVLYNLFKKAKMSK